MHTVSYVREFVGGTGEFPLKALEICYPSADERPSHLVIRADWIRGSMGGGRDQAKKPSRRF